ncbi:MAG: fatty acid desaturase [Pseudomonadota bacterium]
MGAIHTRDCGAHDQRAEHERDRKLLLAFNPLLPYFIVLPLLDMFIGEDAANPPEAVVEQMSQDQHYRRLLYVAAIVLWTNFLVCAWAIGTQGFPLWVAGLLTVAAGVASGSGLTVAHELGHKPSRMDQWGAKFVAAISGYGHFMIEHNRGHHMQVATPEDAASARLGEGLWRLACREIRDAFCLPYSHRFGGVSWIQGLPNGQVVIGANAMSPLEWKTTTRWRFRKCERQFREAERRKAPLRNNRHHGQCREWR